MKQFLGLTGKDKCVYKDAFFAVVPAPLECSVSYGAGTAAAPAAIIDASYQVELYDIDLGEEIFRRKPVYTFKSVCTKKEAKDKRKRAQIIKKTEQTISGVIKDGKIPVLLGGEHTISFSAISAVKKCHKDIIVLHFDAHSDLRDSYEGDKFSHASVMKRVFDMGIDFVSLGIRSQCIEEAEFIKERKLQVFYMKDILRNRKIIDKALAMLKGRKVYITFDVDCLDPSALPATGTPEPGGFLWNDILEIFRKIALTGCKITGFDLVELAPQKSLHASDFLCARLIYKMMGILF